MTAPFAWPALPLAEWQDTRDTIHMWSQIVGKISLHFKPRVNHWWESALHVTSRGLTTGPIPHDGGYFEIELDFIDHYLVVRTSQGSRRILSLAPKSVARFYFELMDELRSLGISVKIDPMPKEVPNPIPCDQDHTHASYDFEYAHRFWQVLVLTDRVFNRFRSRFIGKCSPVHFFWGSFDLAVTRFSGRRAPDRPGVDSITREAYSHEVISCGFWPGSGNIQGPAFYSYAAPEPPGYQQAKILPKQAFYNPPTRGHILMYDEALRAPDREEMILDFCQSAYEAAANLAGWDRASLERSAPPAIRIPAA